MPQTATPDTLQQQIEILQNQNKALKEELQELKRENQAPPLPTQLNAVFQYAPSMLLMVDNSCMIQDVNEYWLSQMGYLREEVIGHSFHEFVHHTEAQIPVVAKAPFICEKVLHKEPYQLQKKDGTHMHIVLSAVGLKYIGKKEVTLAIITDITNEIIAKEALRTREEELRLVFDNLNLGVSVLSKSQQIIDYNKTLEGWFKETDFSSKPTCKSVFAHGKDHCNDCPATKTLKDGKTRQKTFKINENGSEKVYKVTVSAIRDAHGNINNCIELIDDITRDIQQSNQIKKLTRAIEQCPMAISISDKNGNIEYANPHYYELKEIQSGGIPETSAPAPPTPGDVYERTENLCQAIEKGKEWKGHLRYKNKSGKYHWESTLISPVKDKKGEITDYITIQEDITHQKQMENALYRNKAKLSRAQDLAQVGNWSIDLKTSRMEWSKQTAKIFNVKKQHEANPIESILAVFHPDDREKMESILQSQAGVGSYVFRFMPPHQEIKYLAISYEFIKDENDTPVELLGVVQDISAQIYTQKRIKKSEEYLKTLLDNNHQSFILVNRKRQVITYNALAAQTMQRLFNLDLKAGYDCLDLISDPLKEQFIKCFEQALEGEVSNLDIPYITNNQEVWYNVGFNPVKGHNEQVESINLGAIEITDRKNIEKELKTSRDFAESIITNAHDGICIMDLKGNFRYINKAYERITGFQDKELKGKNFLDITHPDFKVENKVLLKGLLDTEGVKNFEKQIITKAGKPVPVYLSTSVIKNKDGVADTMVSIVKDITKLKEAEAELHKAIATKDKFFSIIAHDLRNPFASILGLTNLIEEDLDDLSQQEIKQYIGHLNTASQTTYRLLENLLEWARSQRGNIILNPEKLDIFNLVLENISVLRESATKKHINIISDVPFNCLAYADHNTINTVIRNLISNAIKFTPNGGKIIIGTHMKNHMLEVYIQDNGIGIRKEDLNKLFHIDTKFKTLGTNNESGTGLGLILCKEFVEQNKGEIRVESIDGQGTTFFFTIPQL